MALMWTDVNEIAIELCELYPDVDPVQIRFTDLREWVLALEDFDDDPSRCGEKIFEAIQMVWIEETD